jgi:hypothetical protein
VTVLFLMENRRGEGQKIHVTSDVTTPRYVVRNKSNMVIITQHLCMRNRADIEIRKRQLTLYRVRTGIPMRTRVWIAIVR